MGVDVRLVDDNAQQQTVQEPGMISYKLFIFLALYVQTRKQICLSVICSPEKRCLLLCNILTLNNDCLECQYQQLCYILPIWFATHFWNN